MDIVVFMQRIGKFLTDYQKRTLLDYFNGKIDSTLTAYEKENYEKMVKIYKKYMGIKEEPILLPAKIH